MPRSSHTIELDAPAERVFDVIHDYDRRLEWDTMLSEATVLGDVDRVDVGVETRCVGTWRGLWIPMVTRYVSFRRGEVAAVKLTGRSPFFAHFAATIRHRPIGPNRSSLDYIYSFRAKPRLLAPILEPILDRALKKEVVGRMEGLRRVVEGVAEQPAQP